MKSLPKARIGDVCRLLNGRAFKPTDWGKHGLPIVRIQNLNNLNATFNYFNGEVKEKFLIDTGELLFSWSGTPGTSFGAFFWQRGKAVLNQHIFRVLVDSAKVDKDYFRYALNSRLNHIIDQSHGGVGLKHITKGKLEATKVPLPPLQEQKRIAAILDKADSIRRSRQKAIALTEELLRSTFLDMFGDPVTNPKGWEKKPLYEIADILTGYPFKSSQYVDSDEGIRLCRGANVLPDSLNWKDVCFWDRKEIHQFEKFKLQANDVIVALDRPWISSGFKIAVVTQQDLPAFLVQRVARIRATSKSLQEYLYFSLRHHSFEKHCRPTETTVPHISPTDLKTYTIPVPGFEQISHFNSLVNIQKKILMRLKSQSNDMDILFNSLLQKAFRGEL